jgi:hypothetical protein
LKPHPSKHIPPATSPGRGGSNLNPCQSIRVVWTIWLSLVFMLTSCTAAKVNITLIRAQEDLHNAKEYGAETRAPYEFTRAERYLQKAAEEYRGADYKIADALCQAASEWADRAIIVIQQRGRVEIGVDDLAAESPDASPQSTEGNADQAPTPPPAEEPDEFEEFKELEPEDEEETFDWEEE